MGLVWGFRISIVAVFYSSPPQNLEKHNLALNDGVDEFDGVVLRSEVRELHFWLSGSSNSMGAKFMMSTFVSETNGWCGRPCFVVEAMLYQSEQAE